MPRLRALPVAALLLLAACHHGSTAPAPDADFVDERGVDREAVLLSSWRPPTPQRCQVARLPETLPAPESLISTADMPILLEQGGIRDARGSALVSLKFDSTGRIARLGTIESTFDDGTREALEKVLLSAIEPQRGGRAWGVRLRVDLDSVPRYRVGRSERCAAAMLPFVGAGMPMGTSAGPVGPSAGSSSKKVYIVKFAVAINEDGKVTDVKPAGGNTVDPNAIQSLMTNLQNSRWAPERDDGIPVATVVEHTSRIELVLVAVPR